MNLSTSSWVRKDLLEQLQAIHKVMKMAAAVAHSLYVPITLRTSSLVAVVEDHQPATVLTVHVMSILPTVRLQKQEQVFRVTMVLVVAPTVMVVVQQAT